MICLQLLYNYKNFFFFFFKSIIGSDFYMWLLYIQWLILKTNFWSCTRVIQKLQTYHILVYFWKPLQLWDKVSTQRMKMGSADQGPRQAQPKHFTTREITCTKSTQQFFSSSKFVRILLVGYRLPSFMLFDP